VLAAAEAVPGLSIRRDDERRGLLGVEGAEALLHGAGSLQRDGLADDVGDGEFRFDLGNDAG
jgi:hypothetical protein